MSTEKQTAPKLSFTLPLRFHEIEKQVNLRFALQARYLRSLDYTEDFAPGFKWLILRMATSPYTWSLLFLTRLMFNHFGIFFFVMIGVISFRIRLFKALKKIGLIKNRLLQTTIGMPFQETSKEHYQEALRSLEQLRLLKKLLADWQRLIAPKSEIRGAIDLTPHSQIKDHHEITTLPLASESSNTSEKNYKSSWTRLYFKLSNDAELCLYLDDYFRYGILGTIDDQQRVITAKMQFKDKPEYAHAAFPSAPSELKANHSIAWVEAESYFTVQSAQAGFSKENSGELDAKHFFDAFKAAYLKLSPIEPGQTRLFQTTVVKKAEQTQPKPADNKQPALVKAEHTQAAPTVKIAAPAKQAAPKSERHNSKDELAPSLPAQQAPPKLTPLGTGSKLKVVSKTAVELALNKSIESPAEISPAAGNSISALVQESLKPWLKKSLLSPKPKEMGNTYWLLSMRGQDVSFEPLAGNTQLLRARIWVPKLDSQSAEDLMHINPGLCEIALSRDQSGQTYVSRIFDPTLEPKAIDPALKVLIGFAQQCRFSVPREQVRADLTVSKNKLTTLLGQAKLPWELSESGVWVQSPQLAITRISQVVNVDYQTGLQLIQQVQLLSSLMPSDLEFANSWNQSDFHDFALGIETINGTSSLVLSTFLTDSKVNRESLINALKQMSLLGSSILKLMAAKV